MIPRCYFCKHFNKKGKLSCKAFEEIPLKYLLNQEWHTTDTEKTGYIFEAENPKEFERIRLFLTEIKGDYGDDQIR